MTHARAWWCLAAATLGLCLGRSRGAFDGPVIERHEALARALSAVFLAKEGTGEGAQHALRVFHGATRQHILTNDPGKANEPYDLQTQPPAAKLSLPSQLYALLSNAIQPLVSYLTQDPATKYSGLIPNVTAITSHGDPNLAYFVDPNQNPVLDFFKFASKNYTSLGSVTGPDFIDYAPCWVSNSPTGVYLSADVINFIPSLLSVNPAGVQLLPTGVFIQPAVIYIAPYGVQFTPEAINIAPSLISIIPFDTYIAPEGVNVAPELISDTGRKLLEDNPAQAKPMSQHDVFLASYGKWAVTLANMLNFKAGGVPSKAAEILDAVVGEVQSDISDLMTGNLTDLLPAPESFSDPSFFSDLSSNISSSSRGFSLSSAFLNFMPCAVSNLPAGVQITASGVTVSPYGVFINPVGVESQVSAINIMPTVIWVSPEQTNIFPSAVSVTPTLISISPTRVIHQPQGRDVAPTGIAIDSSGNVTFGSGR